MGTKFGVLLVSIAAALAACASPPPPPMSPDSAGLAIRVRTRAPLPLFKNKAQSVIFSRLEGPETAGHAIPAGAPGPAPAPFTQGETIKSNYEKGDYIYLLNVPPGRYVAVASSRKQENPPPAGSTGVEPGFSVTVEMNRTMHYATYFPQDVVELTEVTVDPGEIAFMGELVLDSSTSFEDSDETLLYFYRRFAPGHEGKGFWGRVFSNSHHYRGSLHGSDHGEEAQERFRSRARKALTKAGWAEMLE